jgi:hypothetical protein
MEDRFHLVIGVVAERYDDRRARRFFRKDERRPPEGVVPCFPRGFFQRQFASARHSRNVNAFHGKRHIKRSGERSAEFLVLVCVLAADHVIQVQGAESNSYRPGVIK